MNVDDSSWSGGGNSTLASLPMIGLDDLAGPAPAPAAAPIHNGFPPAPAPSHNGYPAAPQRPHYPERPEHRAQEHRGVESLAQTISF